MPRIVVGLLDAGQEFQQLQAQDARAAGRQLKLDVEVCFAEGHAVVQIQQLFRHIHAPPAERPAAIVVEPATGEGLERVARNAVKAGIGWMLVNADVAYLDELRAAHPELPIAIVGTDQREVGRIEGRQARALAPAGGRILYVQGPADAAPTTLRLEGLKQALGEGFELHGVNGDWTEAGGERAVASWLRLKTAEALRPDVVACQNDSMAIGARKALSANRPDWAGLPLLGCDGLPEGGQKQVAQGLLAGTVVTPSNTGTALELVARFLETKQALPREVLLAPRSHPPEDRIGPRRSA